MFTTIAFLALGLYLFLGLFYFGFLSYSAVQEHGGWAGLPLIGKICLPIPFLCFLLMDYFANLTLGSLIFLQWPTIKTATFSVRCKTLIDGEPTTWRGLRANKIVNSILIKYTKHY